MDPKHKDDHNTEAEPLLDLYDTHHASSSSHDQQQPPPPPEYHVDMTAIDNTIKCVRHPTPPDAVVAPVHHQCACQQQCPCQQWHSSRVSFVRGPWEWAYERFGMRGSLSIDCRATSLTAYKRPAHPPLTTFSTPLPVFMSTFSNNTPQISIFDIPHILDLICGDLSKDQLLTCLEVSRTWRTNFTLQALRHVRFSNLKSRQTWTVLHSAGLIRSLTIDIADAGWFLDNAFGSSYYANLRELHCVDFNYRQKPKPVGHYFTRPSIVDQSQNALR
ncbi:hypothetical protein BGX30_004533, partial [Mortierella sp. GBA39]